MVKQCNNCKHWRLGTSSLDDNYCNLTGEWSDYEGYCDRWGVIQMTENKRFTYMEQFNGFCDVYDNGKLLSCMRLDYVDKTVNLLNDLAEENKDLKQQIKILKKSRKIMG